MGPRMGMEEDQEQLGLLWGLGWRRTRHSWGCFGVQDGGGPGTVGAALGPKMEGSLAQLRPCLGPDKRGLNPSQGLGAQDGGGAGTVGAALGPRQEEGLAKFELLWGLGLKRTRLRWGCSGAWAGGGPSTVGASSGPSPKGGPGTARALGPRMEQDQTQLGLLWGVGRNSAWHC